MINSIRDFSTEEKLLVQAATSDYFNQVTSVGLVSMTWSMRSLAPNEPGVIALNDFVSSILNLQSQIAFELSAKGIPQDVIINAPISKTVFQSLTQQKKDALLNIFTTLNEKLGDLKVFGVQAFADVWNNKLVR